MATEEAKFNLALKEGAFELRDYLPQRRTGQKIAMTAPVSEAA